MDDGKFIVFDLCYFGSGRGWRSFVVVGVVVGGMNGRFEIVKIIFVVICNCSDFVVVGIISCVGIEVYFFG